MAASGKIAIEEDTDQGLQLGVGNSSHPKGSLMQSDFFADDLVCLKTETENGMVASSDDHDGFYGLHLLAEVAAARCDDRELDFPGIFGSKSDEEFDKNGFLFAVLAVETIGKIPRKRRSVRKKKVQGLCTADQFESKRGLKRQQLETETSKSRSEEQQDGLKLKKRRLVICHGGLRFKLAGALRAKTENIHGCFSFGSGGSSLLAY